MLALGIATFAALKFLPDKANPFDKEATVDASEAEPLTRSKISALQYKGGDKDDVNVTVAAAAEQLTESCCEPNNCNCNAY